MKIVNTFVVPHLNNPGVIRCLKTLWKNTPHNFRVILVDQGEKDIAEEVKDLVHLHIKAYRPLGFSKACNLGWKIADTKYVTLLNDDVEFIDKRWWQGVIDSFADDIVAVNPKTPRDYESGGQIVNKVEYKKEFTELDYEGILKLPWDNMQCMAMFCPVFEQKKAKKIGYFDEFFFPAGGEDTDWTIRAKGLREEENNFRGYEVISTAKSYVWHWWQQSAIDQTFMKARIQLREKWGWDFSMTGATTQHIIPPCKIKQL